MIKQLMARAQHTTNLLQHGLAQELALQSHASNEQAQKHKAELEILNAQRNLADAQARDVLVTQQVETTSRQFEAQLTQRKATQTLDHERLAAQVSAAVEAAGAYQPHLIQAIKRLSDQELLAALTENFGELAAVEGKGLLNTAQRFLDFVPSTLLPTLKSDIGPRAVPDISDSDD